MTVELSDSAKQLLDEQMARGGHESPSDIVEHALKLYRNILTEEESTAALRESIAQMEAGETIPAEQVFDEISAKHGWTE